MCSLLFTLNKYTKTHTYAHFYSVKTSHSPLCVIPSDLADIVVRSLLSLRSLSQRSLWTQLPRKCNTACLFLWLSGMIRNIIMIKLAGGEKPSGSRVGPGQRKKKERESKRLEHCQRVVNKPQERAEVCWVFEFLRVCKFCRVVYMCERKYEFLC